MNKFWLTIFFIFFVHVFTLHSQSSSILFKIEKTNPAFGFQGNLDTDHAFASMVEYRKTYKFYTLAGGLLLTELPVNNDFEQKPEYRNHFYTPYLAVGLNATKYNLSLQPYVNIGYTLVQWNADLLSFDKTKQQRAYSAIGLDLNFKLSKHLAFGVGASSKFHLYLGEKPNIGMANNEYLFQHAKFLNVCGFLCVNL